MNPAADLLPLARPDPTLADAVERAMTDLGRRWADTAATGGPEACAAQRVALRDAIGSLGFAEILPALDDRDAWPDCAAVLRASAGAAVPVDLALWIVTGDADAAIADDPMNWTGASLVPGLTGDGRAAFALARALQIVAAMRAALDLSIGYVQDRKQFGRTLAKFQAIQHSLAVAAEHVASAGAGTDLALAAACSSGVAAERTQALLDAAALVVDDAVDQVYDICHQVHGAIGFTREYALHRHTVDMQRWRESLMGIRGHDAALRLGERVAHRGRLWGEVIALMTSRAD
ncbi:MAG: acyl-CoA dehydrogenase family protein [Burkholderiaceae bacterium]